MAGRGVQSASPTVAAVKIEMNQHSAMRSELPGDLIQDANMPHTVDYKNLAAIPSRASNYLLTEPCIAMVLNQLRAQVLQDVARFGVERARLGDEAHEITETCPRCTQSFGDSP